MSRNKYLEAAGVVRLRWKRGNPPKEAGPVIVEVWQSELDIEEWTQADRPRISVDARLEVRIYVDNAWHVLRWGKLRPVDPGDVRRWAKMNTRHWHATLTIDGWNKDTE